MLSNITDEFIIKRLRAPEGKISMVLDTDTYNEIDDQFALVYALKSSDRLNVEAVYAAPFSNDRAASPGEGMEKSYDEIIRVLNCMNRTDVPVFKGSTDYLKDAQTPRESPAVRDLINRAMNADEPLYVVGIAAATNIASAILLEPEIIKKIVVVWLGGNALYWPTNMEFNLQQDVAAAQILFDSGVPLVQIPCMNVAAGLTTTVYEMQHFLDGKSDIASYLFGIFRDYVAEKQVLTKEIWDISAVAYLVNPEFVPTEIVHSPVLNDSRTWSMDNSRHFIRAAFFIARDAVFRDLYKKLRD